MKEILVTSTVNTVEDVVTIAHQSTGTPAAGFGVAAIFGGLQKLKIALGSRFDFKADSSMIENADIGRIGFEWAIPTHANRTSHCVISLAKHGGSKLVEVCRIDEEGRIGIRDNAGNLKWIDLLEAA